MKVVAWEIVSEEVQRWLRRQEVVPFISVRWLRSPSLSIFHLPISDSPPREAIRYLEGRCRILHLIRKPRSFDSFYPC